MENTLHFYLFLEYSYQLKDFWRFHLPSPGSGAGKVAQVLGGMLVKWGKPRSTFRFRPKAELRSFDVFFSKTSASQSSRNHMKILKSFFRSLKKKLSVFFDNRKTVRKTFKLLGKKINGDSLTDCLEVWCPFFWSHCGGHQKGSLLAVFVRVTL